MLTEFTPATSVDVECIFSHGRLLLSHVRSRLSAQSTQALLCLGSWSLAGMVKDEDVSKVAVMADVEGDDELELEEGWDTIKKSFKLLLCICFFKYNLLFYPWVYP